MDKMLRRIRVKAAKRKAFSVVEILLAVAIIGVLFGLIFAFYKAAIDKSKHVDAVATVDAISKAEEIYEMNNGEYVAAGNTQEVNEKLGLNIEPRWYNYKVVGVTNDNFIVLAERILDDINNGNIQPEQIARNKSGPVSPDSIPEGNEPESPAPTSNPENGNSGNDSSGGDSGGGGGGDSGGGSPTSPTDDSEAGGSPTGGESSDTVYPSTAPVPASILGLLNGTASSQWLYDLITANNIKVVYVNMADYGESEDTGGFWTGLSDQWKEVDGNNVFVGKNTIYVNKNLASYGWTDAAIATIVAHEATHADYSYYPEQNAEATIARHPEVTDSDLHITRSPFDSIDQEYMAFSSGVNLWNEIKGTESNEEMDYEARLAARGEAAFKTVLRSMSSYKNLPEY